MQITRKPIPKDVYLNMSFIMVNNYPIVTWIDWSKNYIQKVIASSEDELFDMIKYLIIHGKKKQNILDEWKYIVYEMGWAEWLVIDYNFVCPIAVNDSMDVPFYCIYEYDAMGTEYVAYISIIKKYAWDSA